MCPQFHDNVAVAASQCLLQRAELIEQQVWAMLAPNQCAWKSKVQTSDFHATFPCDMSSR